MSDFCSLEGWLRGAGGLRGELVTLRWASGLEQEATTCLLEAGTRALG